MISLLTGNLGDGALSLEVPALEVPALEAPPLEVPPSSQALYFQWFTAI